MTDPRFQLFSRAAYDQYEAAVANDDWPTAARIAVEGYLRVIEFERGNEDVTIEDVIPAMLLLDRDSLTLWAAEAIRRLYNETRPK